MILPELMMVTGIKIRALPTESQKEVLSRWMGCSKFIWNAKCGEERYFSTFARKYMPVGTYAPVDQTYSQFKSNELSPWLSECPSQILRNSASNWYSTFQNFMRGLCGKPKFKKKTGGGSVHLTRELFEFKKCEDGVTRLFIGAKKNNIGFLQLKIRRKFKIPASIRISKKNGAYFASFCYDDGLEESELKTAEDHLKYLRGSDRKELESMTVGIDRGVVRPVQAGGVSFDLTNEQKRKKALKEKCIKKYQRRLARQDKGSKRREKTKHKIARTLEKIANIRKDFCHKTSKKIVNNPKIKVIILEDLKTKNMTKKPKAKQVVEGRWEKNGAAAKAGLNKAILDKGWHTFETFLKYKAERTLKAIFKIPANHTSQECAACGHIHPDNRQSQSKFVCLSCRHTDNADVNAAAVIKKRAINLILDPGTGLSSRGVLLRQDIGRGAKSKTSGDFSHEASGAETSKKKMPPTSVGPKASEASSLQG
jgi:putative transposase